jgi:CHASE2 domain-containing sensor protein
MKTFYSGFISYGRLDSKSFAIHLYQQLRDQGFSIWLDQSDIPLGVDFQNQIDDGIEKSDSFLYIIAPHSINSPYCAKEVNLALRRNKRIIPLLHVEQISQKTWQERNPNGSEEQWEQYKSRGLHSSFPNMHPAIGKINWVYFREEIDDFEKSFAGLVELLNRDKDYVRQHTYLLSRSLEWERNQKQTRYLLVGEERLQAEQWLQAQFKDHQPPCEPTDLHCEFICESIQNAQNLATRVFLSHSESDRDIRDKIRQSLMRHSLTVWTNKADIKTGTEFQVEINYGIESADMLVFMISPASLQSVYCQQEVDYALQLNKRIIPLLVEPTDINEIPSEVRSLQFIDFTTRSQESHHQISLDKLLKSIQEDSHYYEQHKILLTRALKWQRQNRNPSVLLRGHNLQQAEAWFKVAKQRSQHPPTALQEEFITTSLQQPPELTLEVFISYSRADSDFARRINDALQMQGKTTWFDQESIASSSNFKQEIYRGIETCNHFLFVISPTSVNSPYCADEVEYAERLGKRVITVLYQPVDTATLHPGLANIQWIDFNRYNNDFYANFSELIRTLDTNLDYTRFHTRLLIKAVEWQRSDREPSYLLRGKDLKESEQWLRESGGMQPTPSDLHKEYILTSRKAPYPKPKLRTVAFTSLAATIVTIILRATGVMQPVELAIYDQMMRNKPVEPKDDRILVVGIEESDIQKQIKAYPLKGWGTMPDPTILSLIDRLQAAKPRVIGLDMNRDYETYVPELSNRFRNDRNLIFVCRHPYGNDIPGAIPPSEVAPERLETQVGFSDSVKDYDLVMRRQVVIEELSDICPVENAFSLIVAQKYLAVEQQPYGNPFNAEGDYVQPLRFGNTVFSPLESLIGGYRESEMGGYQIMLNYRRPVGDVNDFVRRVTLYDVLDGKVPPDQIRDRIVLIGITSKETVRDYAMSPYGFEMAGVLLQAQMVSQFVSATLDGRSLIWWFSPWGDRLWILGWAVIGGAIVWWVQHPTKLVLFGVGAFVLLIGICWGVFAVQSGWLPLFPPLLAMVATGIISLLITHQFRK